MRTPAIYILERFMKRVLTGIGTGILSILLAAGLFGCGQKPAGGSSDAEPTKGGETAVYKDFETIEVTETGTMAFSTVYSCKRTDSGVHVEYYIFQNGWDEENNVSRNEKHMIHSFDGDQAVYQEIAETLGAVPLSSWDGFSKSNSMVTDGSSFSLEIKLSDGSTVKANGTNAYPEGYREFVNRLDAVCATEPVKDTKFETTDYSFSVPESWIGTVYAVYRDGMIGFEVKTKKKDRMILCFYEDSYDYGSGLSDYIPLVSFQKEDQTWFVKMRRMADSYSALEEMNSKQQEICKSLDEDMKAIKSSFKLKGDYEIVEEPATGEGEQSYVSGYYQDPNSSNQDEQENSDNNGEENAEENKEENEEKGNDSEGDAGNTDEENNGGSEDEGNDEGAADEGAGDEDTGGEDGGDSTDG